MIAMKSIYTLKFKRRRQGKTNYKKRLNMLKSEKSRLVIRKSLTNMYIQLINFEPIGDKIIISGSGFDLKKLGWKHNAGNTPAAYLIGLLTGKKMIGKGMKEAVLDIGMQKSTKGCRLFAALKGVVDAGVEVPHSEEILPSEDRITGKHIDMHLKNNITKNFEEVKSKILKS